jgi:hypothetical protein
MIERDAQEASSPITQARSASPAIVACYLVSGSIGFSRGRGRTEAAKVR